MSFISTQTLNVLTKEIVYRTRLFWKSATQIKESELVFLLIAAYEFFTT